jgi:diguanylate cyclase (GGDEF)-like protein
LLQALLDQSQEALDSGRSIEGAAYSRQAIELAVQLADRPGQAAALCLLARQLTRLGSYEECSATCDRAAAILQELDDQVGLCDILIVQALALNELGLSEEALGVLAVAREVAARRNDRTLLYWVLNRIAVVHSGMHDFRRAQDFQLRALALSEGLDEDARFCIINNLSDNAIGFYRQLHSDGDAGAEQVLRDGLMYAETALAMAVRSHNSYRQVLSLDNGGMLSGLAGNYVDALDKLVAARELAAHRGYQGLELAARHHTASVLLLRGDPGTAAVELSAVLERALELGEPPTQLGVLLELSSALELTGQFEAALHRYKQFVALERQLGSTVAATRARMLVHLVDLDAARLDAADARTESQIYRERSRELEGEIQALEKLAVELDRRANEDALTRLSNRLHLETELPRMFADSTASGRGLVVVVLDIDHFKHVNDSFGHSTGDAVLVRVAQLLTQSRRAGDLVGRLGGEEFLLAFQDMDERSAVALCQRLRLNIQDHDWSGLRPGLQVTVSLGVCARSIEAEVQELLERADARMYHAKRAGRNRVEWHSAVPSGSTL